MNNFKKTLAGILTIAFLLFPVLPTKAAITSGIGGVTLWYLDGTTLKPVDPTWTVDITAAATDNSKWILTGTDIIATSTATGVGIGTTTASYGIDLWINATSGYFGVSNTEQGDIFEIDENGDVIVKFDLDVTGTSSFTGDITGSADLNIAGTSSFTGDMTLSSDFNVTGTSSFIGDVDMGDNLTVVATTTSGDIEIPDMILNSPTYRSINDWFSMLESAGRLTGGAISDATGQQINVAAGTGIIRIADDDISQVKFFDWAASSTIDIASGTVQYIGIEYNAGTPRVATSSADDWDLDTEFALGSVINEQGTLHILGNSWWVGDGLTNIIKRVQSNGSIVRDDYIGGLILSVSGTQNIAVSEGTLWSRLNEFPITALDTSLAGTFETYWVNSGDVWTSNATDTYSTLYWNDTGEDALQNINNNYYANYWVYAEADDDEISLVYPQAQYSNSAVAEAETPPTEIPVHIRENGILIGRILFKQNTATPLEVESVFTTIFSASQATDHGNLSGLGDDDHSIYTLVTGARAFTGDVTMNEKLTVTGTSSFTGYVGIGTTTPAYGLEINASSSDGYLAISGGNITADLLELDENGKLTVAGVIDFGASTSLEIPNGAAPTVDATGEIAIDTTSDQYIYYGSAAKRVLSPFQAASFTLESPTNDDDNVPVFVDMNHYYTVTEIGCAVKGDGTQIEIILGDGTNAMDTLTCTTATSSDAALSNNTFIAGEVMEMDSQNASGTPDWIIISITRTIDAD